MLYYEFYSSLTLINEFIDMNADSIQCVVSKHNIPFGSTQNPELWDYADGIDTISFLKNI